MYSGNGARGFFRGALADGCALFAREARNACQSARRTCQRGRPPGFVARFVARSSPVAIQPQIFSAAMPASSASSGGVAKGLTKVVVFMRATMASYWLGAANAQQKRPAKTGLFTGKTRPKKSRRSKSASRLLVRHADFAAQRFVLGLPLFLVIANAVPRYQPCNQRVRADAAFPPVLAVAL